MGNFKRIYLSLGRTMSMTTLSPVYGSRTAVLLSSFSEAHFRNSISTRVWGIFKYVFGDSFILICWMNKFQYLFVSFSWYENTRILIVPKSYQIQYMLVFALPRNVDALQYVLYSFQVVSTSVSKVSIVILFRFSVATVSLVFSVSKVSTLSTFFTVSTISTFSRVFKSFTCASSSQSIAQKVTLSLNHSLTDSVTDWLTILLLLTTKSNPWD